MERKINISSNGMFEKGKIIFNHPSSQNIVYRYRPFSLWWFFYYLFWWLIGDKPSLWPSKIFLTKSKIIGGKVKMAAFNFFLKSNCNVGFKVRVKFQIWSKAMGSLNVTSLAAVTKTLKAVFATLEWPLVRFWKVNSKANNRCWISTWNPLANK